MNKFIATLRKFESQAAKLLEAATAPAEPASQTIVTAPAPVPVQPLRVPTAASQPAAPTKPQIEGRWISDAMERLQQKAAQTAALRQQKAAQAAQAGSDAKTYRAPANANGTTTAEADSVSSGVQN